MISSKNINNEIKSTVDFVAVISRIRYTVGWFACAFDVDTVLILSKCSCSKPRGTILIIDQIIVS